ncbi:hypothetical protein F2Q68_00041912 [Brassica cretica]|uniref:Uncharacterized protein n=1 Tax=Brassica cretica TaxID=69181 RepID=A0A8S9MEH7_BRACR|nr:hypothetical protein F2Q68_00041912 [Brassica cretica]
MNVEKLLESERFYNLFQILMNKISGPVLILGSRVLVPEDDFQEVDEEVSALFPYNIEIRPHEDESQLSSWKNRLEDDMKMFSFKTTRTKVSLMNLNIIASLQGYKRHKSDTIDRIKKRVQEKECITHVQQRSLELFPVNSYCKTSFHVLVT